jgi:very-short-patch-repair endonuclease
MLSFEKSFASHEKSKYLIDSIDSKKIALGSSKKYNFKCNICNHIFTQQIGEIVKRNGWCPYCCIPTKKLCEDINCQHCFNKSFASHEKSKYLIDDVNPRQIMNGTGKKYNFKCNNCEHIFECVIGSITVKTSRNNWCPYCSKTPKKLCEDINCQHCFNKSFASHDKSKYLIDNNINPRQIFKYSNLKFNFKCNECSHIFDAYLSGVSNDNGWCPYCANCKLCKDDNCLTCYNKSFAVCEKSKFLCGNVNPREIFKSSSYKFDFECDKCKNIFKSDIYRVTGGHWCPVCKNKTEKKLFEFLKLHYPKVKFQCKFEWCKDKDFLKFDFVIEELKIIIELDGHQHFIQVMNWSNPEDNLNRDIYKMKTANKNGYTIIRILQKDVYDNKDNWDKKLLDAIKNNNKTKNTYIAKNLSIYDKHIEMMN